MLEHYWIFLCKIIIKDFFDFTTILILLEFQIKNSVTPLEKFSNMLEKLILEERNLFFSYVFP